MDFDDTPDEARHRPHAGTLAVRDGTDRVGHAAGHRDVVAGLGAAGAPA